MNKFVSKLRALENVVKERFDPWAEDNLIRSSSPGINWIFGKTHGLPRGYSIVSWGEQKAGKSILFYDLAGQVHKKWPDAIVIKVDSEFRDQGQLDEIHAAAYGIDLDRFIVIQSNSAVEVFDTLNHKVLPMLQDGAMIPLMGMDSINMLLGRKTEATESLGKFTIGDHAQTLQIGLQSIRGMLFKYRILLYLTAHARDEMDQVEVMRGNKKKMGAANAVKHLCEFCLNVERNRSKSGNQDELENKLVDESKLDMSDDAERTGHKIRFWLQSNTIGASNRVAEVTFDYQKGFINQHEEIFRLGKNWGIFERVNAQTWRIGSEEFRGKATLLEALKTRVDLQQYVIKGLQAREATAGTIVISSEQAEKEFDDLDNLKDE